MQVEIEFVIYRGDEDEEEIELTIQGYVEPYVPPNLWGHPDNWTPPEGGGAYVEQVFHNGKLWDGELTQKELEAAEIELYQAWEDGI